MCGGSLSPGVLPICLLISSLLASAPALAQGPQRVPVLVPPVKRPPTGKKDRSGFPPIPTFKDIAQNVGLTVPHIAASEAHYVIDSTSGGAGDRKSTRLNSSHT